MDYAFKPESTLVVALTYPVGRVTPLAAAWIKRHWPEPLLETHIQQPNIQGPVDLVRCLVARHHCLKAPPEIEQFLFMDYDMLPGLDADAVLTTPGDIVGCRYPVPNDATWETSPTTLHMGLMRVSRAVLSRLAEPVDGKVRPLWAFPRNDDNTKVLACECGYFVGRAKQEISDVKIVRVGFCGHLPKQK